MKDKAKIEIEATELTPYVLLDSEKGLIKMEGYSYPDSPFIFYTDIIDWFRAYCARLPEETNVSFGFYYVNSTSVKFINEILKQMDKLADAGKRTMVTWYMRPDDEDIEQLGLELKGLHHVPFTFLTKEEKAGSKKSPL